MGLRISKKKNNVKNRKKSNRLNNNYNDSNSVIAPTTSEPILSLAKRNSSVGYCGFNNGCISVIDFKKFKIQFSINAHTKEVTRMKYLTKSCLLCSVSRDKYIKLWSQIDEGGIDEELRCDYFVENAHDLVITSLDISHDEKSLVTGSRDNTVKLWDVAQLGVKSVCKLSRNLVTCTAFSALGSMVAVTGEDKIVRILDPNSLDVVKEFPKKNYIQTHCHFSLDEKYLVSTSNGFNGNGCEISVWDVRAGKLLVELGGGVSGMHGATVSCAMFLPPEWRAPASSDSGGGPMLASCAQDGQVGLWQPLASADCLSHCAPTPTAVTGPLNCLLPLEPARRLAVATNSAGVVVLEQNPSCGTLYAVGSI